MRIHVHDFAGHPFQIELSRELARRGHQVSHYYGAQVVTGRGRLDLGADDPPTLRIAAIETTAPMVRYALRGRVEFERSYARSWQDRLRAEAHDVMMCANTPLGVLAMTRRHLRTPWVLWHQDITSLAIGDEAARRLPAALAGPLAKVLQNTEKRLVASSNRVVAIGPQFLDQYRRWGLDTSHVDVIPNWAPLEEIRPGDHHNQWADTHDLARTALRLVYAGTLGRKHNPLLLVELLDRLREAGTDASLLVLSEGDGADLIAAAGRPDVRVLPFQPVADLPDVFACADVLVALLEPDTAQFSIPSKVLSYLAAGRPVLALAPRDNPCADDVIAAGGLVVDPSTAGVDRAVAWLRELAGDAERARRIGWAGRELAEQKFDASTITDRFEALLADAAGARRARHRQL